MIIDRDMVDVGGYDNWGKLHHSHWEIEAPACMPPSSNEYYPFTTSVHRDKNTYVGLPKTDIYRQTGTKRQTGLYNNTDYY
jgi:hypothetical protein